jgi:hypothetical protein
MKKKKQLEIKFLYIKKRNIEKKNTKFNFSCQPHISVLTLIGYGITKRNSNPVTCTGNIISSTTKFGLSIFVYKKKI